MEKKTEALPSTKHAKKAETQKNTRPLPKSLRSISSAGGRYPSGVLFCVDLCYPSTILCDSMLTNRQLFTKSVPMLLAQSGDAYNFPSYLFFFVFYPARIICFHTESCSFLHPPLLLVRQESLGRLRL